MSTMFWDIKRKLGRDLRNDRVRSVPIDEVLYADDTICISSTEEITNLFLR